MEKNKKPLNKKQKMIYFIVMLIGIGLIAIVLTTGSSSAATSPTYNMSYSQSNNLDTIFITGGSPNVLAVVNVYESGQSIYTSTFYQNTTFTVPNANLHIIVTVNGVQAPGADWTINAFASSPSGVSSGVSLTSLEDGLIIFAFFVFYDLGVHYYRDNVIAKKRARVPGAYSPGTVGDKMKEPLDYASMVVSNSKEADLVMEISRIARDKYGITDAELIKRMEK